MKLNIKKASTSQTVYLFIQDSSVATGAGKTGLAFGTGSLVAYYVRPLAAAAAITLITQTVTGAWSSGGFVEVDSANMPGVYRLDLPDAVLATGVNSVVVMLKGAANMAPVLMEIQLVSTDPNDAVRMGLTALPNAAAGANGGLPLGDASGRVDLSKIAGSAVDATSAQLGVNVVNWKGSTAPAMTGDAFARLGAPAGASVSADVAAVKGETATIQAKTTNLPSDPADASDVAGAFSTVNGTLSSISSAISALPSAASIATAVWGAVSRTLTAFGFTVATDVSSTVSANLDVAVSTRLAPAGTLATVTNLTNAPGAGDFTSTMKTSLNAATPAVTVSDKTGFALTAAYDAAKTAAQAADIPTANQNADALLKRDWTAVTGEAARSVLNALRSLRNKTSISASTLVVTKEDDATSAWTADVTTDAAADPIVSVEPS